MPRIKKNYTVEVYTDKEQWKKIGRGIGGTSASKIIGVSPYGNAITLYCEMLGNKKEQKINDQIVYGIENEDRIRKEFAEKNKEIYKVIKPKTPWVIFRRKDKPWMTATVDGTLKCLKTGQTGIYEGKTHLLRGKTDLENWKARLPKNYYTQLLHYLLVMNNAQFAVLNAELRWPVGNSLNSIVLCYRVNREEVQKELEYLEEKETRFWDYFTAKKIPPIKL